LVWDPIKNICTKIGVDPCSRSKGESRNRVNQSDASAAKWYFRPT